jgi:RNA polymerase sigma-70 factor (ECF subfamily)
MAQTIRNLAPSNEEEFVLNEVETRASKVEAGHSPIDAVEPDDVELVKRCQAGDSSAFNDLVTRYRGRAFTLIYGMVQNEQDAWDLAQEGFLKAWKSIHRFKGESSFYTWLYRIMTNVTIDSLRRKGIHGEAEFDDRFAAVDVEPGSRTTPSSVPLPHKKLEHREIRQRIDEAIAKLSPEHRSVIMMKEIEDMQYNEIADILSCSLGTVMSRLFYARKKLQSLLRDLYENL